MLPLNTTACAQLMMESKIDSHAIGSQPIECLDCLKYCNVCVTIMRPNMGLDIEGNQQVVFQNANYLLKDLKTEEVYFFVKRAEALAASFGLLYQQRKIKEKIPNPKSAEASLEFSESIKRQKDAVRPKKEKKLLTDRDRAIESFTKLGITLEKATAMVDAQLIKEGRAVNPN